MASDAVRAGMSHSASNRSEPVTPTAATADSAPPRAWRRSAPTPVPNPVPVYTDPNHGFTRHRGGCPVRC